MSFFACRANYTHQTALKNPATHVKKLDFFMLIAILVSCFLPGGVTVAQVPLEHFVEVRILAGQPFFLALNLSAGLFLQKCRMSANIKNRFVSVFANNVKI